MAEKESKSKIRIVKIIDILKEETDRDHPISTAELQEKLLEYGINSNRKTIYDDIDVIAENYLDVKTIKSTQNKYYLDERTFEPSEIQIIASAVNAAGFISDVQTKDLVDRLYSLTSKGNANILKSSISLKNPYKHTNKSIFLNIEIIIEAIRKKKKVYIEYFHYNLDKKKDYKQMLISPVDLIYSNELYYCIAYTNNKYYTLRFDKMENVEIVDEDIDKNTYNSKKYIDENFSSKTFQMFSGEEVYVDLKINKNIIDPVLDRFGEKQIITKLDDTWAKVTVLVKETRTFYSWVLSFGERMEILGPGNVRSRFKDYVRRILCNYSEE